MKNLKVVVGLLKVVNELDELFTYTITTDGDELCDGQMKDKDDKSMKYVEAEEVEKIIKDLRVKIGEIK